MLKLFGWESIFAKRITTIQAEKEELEKEKVRTEMFQFWLHKASWQLTPMIVYSAYIWMGGSISLSTIVVAKQFFGKMFFVMHMGPHTYKCMSEVGPVYTKIQEFLDLPDRQKNLRKTTKDSEFALEMKGNFSWGFKNRNGTSSTESGATLESLTDLKAIDFKVKQGEFVCIIGDVGSGKSNLLNAINGEMIYIPDQLLIDESINITDQQEPEWFD